MRPPPVELRPPRTYLVRLIAVSALLVAAGVYVLGRPERKPYDHVWVWAAIVLFGLGSLVFLRELVAPRMRLRLDETGVEMRATGRTGDFAIPWSEMAGTRPVRLRGVIVLSLILRDRDWGIASRRPARRWLRRVNESLAGSDYILNPKMFGLTPEALAQGLERYRRAYSMNSESVAGLRNDDPPLTAGTDSPESGPLPSL